MFGVYILLQILLCKSVIAWINGDSATGPTDGYVVDHCEYWANDIGASDSCESIEAYFGITRQQFRFWNQNLSPSCVITRGKSYCVAGPPLATTPSTTTATRPSKPPDTITYSGTPAPTQSGLTSSCTKYHLVHLRDTCFTIQDEYGNYTLEQFYAWNPSISKGCVGIQPGYYVCVGTEFRSMSVSTTHTPASPTGTPSGTSKGSSTSGPNPHQGVSQQIATSGTFGASSNDIFMWSIMGASLLFLSHPLFSNILLLL